MERKKLAAQAFGHEEAIKRLIKKHEEELQKVKEKANAELGEVNATSSGTSMGAISNRNNKNELQWGGLIKKGH